jgi:hypothetical protein
LGRPDGTAHFEPSSGGNAVLTGRFSEGVRDCVGTTTPAAMIAALANARTVRR